MGKLKTAVLALTHLGPGWAWFRAGYALRRRCGVLKRRTRAQDWPKAPAASGRSCALFNAPVLSGLECAAEADAILAGQFRLFSWRIVEAGFPPDWGRNWLSDGGSSFLDTGIVRTETRTPEPRTRNPALPHWTQISDVAGGDIKGVWELSRFSWAFALARAFARTRETRHAEAFWFLLEDWMNSNPPNLGPQWMCGQEATFRLMAATFARGVCADSPATTPARIARFRSLVLASGRRIAANLGYALSQSNNHGVSECVGLVTAGLLVPEAGESAGWRRRGLARLERQLAELVYADGGFSQHSANYHRVLLHDLLWAIALLRGAGEETPGWLLDAAKRALGFIAALMDPATGHVPLYGANDGANVLPLADMEFADFRPTVQAGAVLLHGERWLPAGPWDEMAAWLAGEAAATTRETGVDWMPSRHWPDAGVAQLRSGDSRLVMRCPVRFRHRPAQADMLHVDIDWRGVSVAIDAGTYGYNATGAFAGGFNEAALHNTVTFDHAEPLTKVSRFLYLPWPRGRVRIGPANEIEATHNAWRKRGVEHVRTATSPAPDVFVVEDRIRGTGRHIARLHWLLADLDYRFEPEAARLVVPTRAGDLVLSWKAPVGARATLVRGEKGSKRGWHSPHYGQALPALSLAVEFEFTGEASITTQLAPAG